MFSRLNSEGGVEGEVRVSVLINTSQRAPPHVARESVVPDEWRIADDDIHIRNCVAAQVEAIGQDEIPPSYPELVEQFVRNAGVDTPVDFDAENWSDGWRTRQGTQPRGRPCSKRPASWSRLVGTLGLPTPVQAALRLGSIRRGGDAAHDFFHLAAVAGASIVGLQNTVNIFVSV